MGFTAFVGRPVQEVAKLLASEAPRVVAGAHQREPDHVIVNLEVPLGREGSVRRPASVTLGIPGWDSDRFRLPLAVTALEREKWFPTFHGSLEADEVGIGDTRLRLIGEYELPLGVLGRASGRAGADKLARASLYSLFLATVTAIEQELRDMAPAWRPAPSGEIVRTENDHPLGA